MSAPHDPLDELAIPDGTTVEEHDVVTDGDVLIGSNSTVDFGIRGRTIAAGERVRFGRQIEAEGDCRLDIWCRTEGSVLAGEDAYIGERTHIGGKLLVSGDLDIGDDVEIEEGFDANGWIVTRNPVPVLVFYFIVLSQFLRLGEADKANEFASALAGDEIEERAPLVIPRGSEISDDAWRVSTPARIGEGCRLHGNVRAESITVGTDTTIFGSLRGRGDIEIAGGTDIIGDVTTRDGTVTLHAGAHVRGDVSCGDLVVHEGAEVDGLLRARGEMKLIQRAASADADEDEDVVDPEDTPERTHDEPAAPGDSGAVDPADADPDDPADADADPDTDDPADVDADTEATVEPTPGANVDTATADTADTSGSDEVIEAGRQKDPGVDSDDATDVDSDGETDVDSPVASDTHDDEVASTDDAETDADGDTPAAETPAEAGPNGSLVAPDERADVEILDAEADAPITARTPDRATAETGAEPNADPDVEAGAETEPNADPQPNPDSSSS